MTKIVLLAITFLQFGLLQAQITRIKMGRQSDTTKEVSFRLAERYQAYNWNAKVNMIIMTPQSIHPSLLSTLRMALSLCAVSGGVYHLYMMPSQKSE